MKKRIITAIIMGLVVIPFIIIGGPVFKVGVSLVAMLGLKELWDLKKSHNEYPLLIKLLSLISLIFMMLINNSFWNKTDISLVYVGIPYFSIILAFMLLILPSILYDDKYTTKDAFYLLGITIFIAIGARILMVIRDIGVYDLIYILLLSILNEAFGLFVGLKYGHHKLLPKVSPKKSIEGAIGGLLLGSLISIVFAHFTIMKICIKLILYTVILGVVGQFGDLLFSKIKRENDIKDFANLLPGHGGILDRIDSLIWVALFYIILFI